MDSEEPGLIEQLRIAIRESGFSLNQLGKYSGVSAGQLSRLMRGERGLTLTAAEKVCQALGYHLAKDDPKKKGRGK
jgi:transcriptional regulator with XRE-family HTH domain